MKFYTLSHFVKKCAFRYSFMIQFQHGGHDKGCDGRQFSFILSLISYLKLFLCEK